MCQFVLHVGLKLSGSGAHSHSNDRSGMSASGRLTCHNYTSHQWTMKAERVCVCEREGDGDSDTALFSGVTPHSCYLRRQ